MRSTNSLPGRARSSSVIDRGPNRYESAETDSLRARVRVVDSLDITGGIAHAWSTCRESYACVRPKSSVVFQCRNSPGRGNSAAVGNPAAIGRLWAGGRRDRVLMGRVV